MLLSCFIVSCENAVTKIFLRSLFVIHVGHVYLPMVWLAFIPFAIISTIFYSKAQRFLCFNKIFSLLILLTASTNILFVCLNKHTSINIALFYFLRELLPLFVFQSLWGINYQQNKKNLNPHSYAWMFSIGALGGIVGSLLFTSFNLTTLYQHFCIANALLSLIIGYFFYSKSECSVPILQKKNISPLREISIFLDIFPQRTTSLLWVTFSVVTTQIISCMQELLLYEAIENHCSAGSKEIIFAWISFTIGCSSFFFPLLNAYLMIKWRITKIHTIFLLSLTCFFCTGHLFLSTFTHAIAVFLSIKIFDIGTLMPSRENFYEKLSKNKKIVMSQYINIILYRGSKAFIGALLLLINDKNNLAVYAKKIQFLACIILSFSYILFNPSYLDYQPNEEEPQNQ